jgi:hypothetical protein
MVVLLLHLVVASPAHLLCGQHQLMLGVQSCEVEEVISFNQSFGCHDFVWFVA